MQTKCWGIALALSAVMGCGGGGTTNPDAANPVDGNAGLDTGTPSIDAGNDASVADAGHDAAVANDVGHDAPTSLVTYCINLDDCSTGQQCNQSLCAHTTDPDQGFCSQMSPPRCGGFAGLHCPTTGQTVCLNQGSCVADGQGICVSPAEHDAICAHEPTLWNCS